jgi:hypothetical protein
MDCALHPGAEAFRVCVRCGKLHCPACVRAVGESGRPLEACRHCDGLLRVAQERVAPPASALAEALRRPFTVEGITTAVALAVPAWARALPGLSTIFGLIYLAALSGAYFMTVDHVGRGRPGLPGPSDRDFDWGESAAVAARGLLCILLVALPAIAWAVHLALRDAEAPDLATQRWAVAGLLLAGLSYTPAAIVAVVVSNSTLAALWPVAWARVILRAPSSYALLVGLFVVTFLAWALAGAIAAQTLGRVPLLGGLLAATVSNLLLLTQAALVGHFLRRNADAFGYSD